MKSIIVFVRKSVKGKNEQKPLAATIAEQAHLARLEGGMLQHYLCHQRGLESKVQLQPQQGFHV